MNHKVCSRCSLDKNLGLFHKDKKTKDGYKSDCKSCRLGLEKHRQDKNRKNILKQRLDFRRNNKEALTMQRKKWYSANKDRIRDRKNELSKQFRARHKNDVQFRLSNILRSRLSKIISGTSKYGSAVTDLGCSVEELKIYLENQFAKGMTWKNYGEWHIDHIIPLSSFNLGNREDLLKACHYTNLQPLWAIDNFKKGARIIERI